MTISRRSFLKSSLAAASFPLILPSRMWGKTAPGNAVTIAMIGFGRMAYVSNLQSFLNMEDVRVVAVCDVDSWRTAQGCKMVDDFYAARDGGSRLDGCKGYRDFREVLARPDIDAVMISTPDHWHVPISLMAARAGKDICCEKPLTLSIEEGTNLRKVVAETGRVFRTDSEFRSLSQSHRACEIVRNGLIGKLIEIKTGLPPEYKADVFVEPKSEPVPEELDYNMWLGPAREAPYQVERVHDRHTLETRPGWMRIFEYCDGVLSNWGTHTNDIAQWGNDSDSTGPVEVQTTTISKPKPGNLWDNAVVFDANFRYANGVKLNCTVSRPLVRFIGEKGWVEANYDTQSMTASSEELRRYKSGSGEVHLPLRGEKADFIDCVRSRKQTIADAGVGHRTNSISHLAKISMLLGGRKLAWDPVSETFPGDAEANALLKRPYVRPPWSIS